MTENNDTKILKKKLKNRLEMELGLPLTPKLSKQVDRDFNDSVILVDNYPIVTINELKIGNEIIDSDDYILVEEEGTIYLNRSYHGMLYLEYTWALPKSDFQPLLDLMMDYELDNSFTKDASSISEKNVSVSYDTSQGKGARIQAMIQDLKSRYACVVVMI